MARNFDGSSGKLTYTYTTPQKGHTTVSYNIHVYRSGPGEGNYGRMFQESDSSTQKNVFYNENGDGGWGLTFETDWSTTNGAWSTAYPTNSEWNIYTVTYDGGSTSNDPIIYKNGEVAAIIERSTPSGSFLTTEDNVVIGNRPDDIRTWNGRLAEFAKWNRILTAAEAAWLGKGGSALFIPNGLVFYAPLVRTANDIKDGVVPSITATSVVDHPRIIYPSSIN